MDRVPVNSKAVSEIGWKDNILEVMYPNGVIYQYTPIPESQFRELIHPNVSTGGYMAIIRRTHQGIKV